MIRDIHVFLLDTGDVKLGSDLLCGENASLKFDLDERVDRYDSHPSAIRGILEFHSAYKAVVSFRLRTEWAQRTHIDRCLLRGAGEGTRAAGCVDGSKGRPLSGECRNGGDLPLSSDLIFEGEAAISRSLALRTALHTRSIDSESSGVAGPDELVEA